MSGRFDLYYGAHMGLRHVLQAAATRAATTDYSDREATEILDHQLRRAIRFLRIHAHVEDSYINPAIEAKVPGITRRNSTEHEEAASQLHALERLLTDIRQSAGADERARALGRVMAQLLREFIADHESHIREEEHLLLPLLWEHYDDDELAALQTRVLTSLSDDDLRVTFGSISPALSEAEQINLLLGLYRTLPDTSFLAVCNELESTLGRASFWDLCVRAGLS